MKKDKDDGEASMNLTRCEMGHFFDRDKFSSCPHCGSMEIQQRRESEAEESISMEIPWKPPMLNTSYIEVEEAAIQKLTAKKVDIYRNRNDEIYYTTLTGG